MLNSLKIELKFGRSHAIENHTEYYWNLSWVMILARLNFRRQFKRRLKNLNFSKPSTFFSFFTIIFYYIFSFFFSRTADAIQPIKNGYKFFDDLFSWTNPWFTVSVFLVSELHYCYILYYVVLRLCYVVLRLCYVAFLSRDLKVYKGGINQHSH